MSQSPPSAPPTPDPYATAGAQGAADVRTAVAQAQLNNIDQTTPFGSVNYREIGSKTMELPDGKNIRVPIYESITKLSDDQNRLLNLTENAGITFGEIANRQANRIGDVLSTPIKNNDLPKLPGEIPKAPNFREFNQAVPQFQGIGSAPSFTSSYDAGGNIQRSIGDSDFEASRGRVEDALFSRLNPQIERDREAQYTRLANQGVTQGSEAYNNAIDELNRQINDQRMQVILAGGQEQSRLFGMDQAAGQFANQAQSQANTQNLQAADFGNNARANEFNLGMTRTQFNNDIEGRNYEAARSAKDYNDAIARQNYDLDLNRIQQQDALRKSGLQEDIALRNQPISEMLALLGGGQPTIPQFQPWNAPTLPSPPVAQSVYNSAALANDAYKTQSMQSAYGLNGMYGLGSTLLDGLFNFMKPSDRRLKRDIEHVGWLKNGLPVYKYRMIGESAAQLGLMADEVLDVHPEAVAKIGDYLAVDYARAVQPVGA